MLLYLVVGALRCEKCLPNFFGGTIVSNTIALEKQHIASRRVYETPKLEHVETAKRFFAQAGSVTIRPDKSFGAPLD